MTDWLKKTLAQLSEAIAKNLGTSIAAFLASGGYLVAIAKLSDFQMWVRQIPTDYVLTPFVLVLVALAAITRITLRQRKERRKFSKQPEDGDDEGRLVTHYGVWWKIYPDAQYMEDFPYCSCCSPQKKLVQTEWHPDEKFKCSVTATEYQLFDSIPWPLEKARDNLYRAYFKGEWLHDHFQKELRRIKTLSPEVPDQELLKSIMRAEPFSRLPAAELEPLLRRFEKPHEVHTLFAAEHASLSQVPFAAIQEAVTGARPNPSIERTSPGKPGAASHLKRWASPITNQSPGRQSWRS